MSNAKTLVASSKNGLSLLPASEQGAQPLSLKDISPRRSDRAFLVGMTGSGKTTLARQLLASRVYVVALDYKRTLNWSDYRLCVSLKELVDAKEAKLIYRPSIFDFSSNENSALLWEWLYQRGNTTIYVDETAITIDAHNMPLYYRACLMQGREHGIEVWSSTQRPLDIPSIIGSESEHVYAFRLRLPQDRKRVEDLTGIQASGIASLTKRRFLYAPQDGDVTGPLYVRFP